MLSVAVAALHEREPEHLWPLIASVLPDVCGGEALIYKLDEWNESSGTVGLSPGVAATFDLLEEGAMGLLRAGYPFAHHYAGGHDLVPVTARQAAGPEWSASPTARLLSKTMDVDHALAVPLPRTTTPITGCLVYRSGRDFDDDDIRIGRQLQPLLAAVEQQRQLLERWRRVVVAGAAGSPRETAADCDLTPRETTVLLLLGDALTAAAMGRRLGISDRTVHKHIENIYRKLGTRDRISTVLRAQRLGLLPLPASPVPGTGRA
ncbi:helix-turn-helix transcriptional regulator [Streptomyces chiangmaiensis]|uniref:LuxR C-terminal-related transcriptional regulator n=1 Tax=Streptomyces chiangmaiensis TaxID=766497 RepID=A0ABU7FCP9_9ACTN|nr:LuxR C-terminal-related transcriptional regulator [Streptomyces chiangmaiensis]MED7821840.1 LuxR C-terminal-related transcriptional regulator [Streptomyces chiangmaiensis]